MVYSAINNAKKFVLVILGLGLSFAWVEAKVE